MKGECVMENNYYNGNQSSGPFYSYNNGNGANDGTNQGNGGSYPNGTAAGGCGGMNASGAPQGNGMNASGMPQGNGMNASGMPQGSGMNASGMPQGSGMNASGASQAGGMNTAGTGAKAGASGVNPGMGNNMYQNSAGQQFYQTADAGPAKKKKKERVKKERKPGGFGIKLVKCAALALVFGLVSGSVFEGVHYVSRQLSGEQQETTVSQDPGSVLTQSDVDGKIRPTSVSDTYVGTDVSDIVEATMPSIVSITNVSESEYRSFWGSQQYESTSAGSGIIVSQDDSYLYIVTNNHVVSGSKSLTVTFANDATVGAEVKGTAPGADLAVIRVPLETIDEETKAQIKVATLGNSDELRVGNGSIAIGNALGYGQSVTTGCISALGREVSVSDSESNTSYTAELIQTEAAINPGNSGGALLNAAGEVIGINSVKYSDTKVEGIGYAIPINTAMPIIEDLITKDKVDEAESAYLGIRGVDVTDEVAEAYGMPNGIFIAQVMAQTAAEQAGLKKGDILTEFDGRAVHSMEELTQQLQYYKAGETVEVTIQRASEGEYLEQKIQVTLGSKVG